MLTDVDCEEPLDPPYPRGESALQGWGYLGILAWLGGGVCALVEFYWGCILLAPGLLWLVQTQRRAGALRRRAVVGLERRAPSMSLAERERDIGEIENLYGGRLSPETQRRFKAVRALPEAPHARPGD